MESHHQKNKPHFLNLTCFICHMVLYFWDYSSVYKAFIMHSGNRVIDSCRLRVFTSKQIQNMRWNWNQSTGRSQMMCKPSSKGKDINPITRTVVTLNIEQRKKGLLPWTMTDQQWKMSAMRSRFIIFTGDIWRDLGERQGDKNMHNYAFFLFGVGSSATYIWPISNN